jgi:hypothetical protein
MDYPWPGSNLLPQDQIGGAPLLFSNLEHPAIENNSTTDFTQWLPIPTTFNHGESATVSASQQGGLASGQRPLPPRLYTTAAVAQLHELAVYSGTNNDNVQSMASPPKLRKRKAPTLRRDDWEPVKARVIELHITQKRPLPEVKEIVEGEFKAIDFTAT